MVTKKAQPIKTIPFDYGLSKYLKNATRHSSGTGSAGNAAERTVIHNGLSTIFPTTKF